METKFKVGDKVTITYHKNKKNVGKSGIVTEVIPVFESQEKADSENYIGKFSVRKEGDTSTAYYCVQCDGKRIAHYATDDCLTFNI